MQNNWTSPKKAHSAKVLHIVSKKIIDLAFSMGGSDGLYYEPIQCNFIFPNGRSCWDEKRGSYDSECPLCKGSGVYYKDPIEVPIIVMDSPNIPKKDNKLGIVYEDTMRIAVPNSITPRIVTMTNNGVTILTPSKFAIKDFFGDTWNILYMQGEPKDVYLAGTLMHTVEVGSNVFIYTNPTVNEKEANLNDSKKTSLLEQINKDVLNLNRTETTSKIVIEGNMASSLDEF